MRKLPVEYQQFFGEQGVYHIVIQIESEGAKPVQLKLKIATEPHCEGVAGFHRGNCTISILAQGSPILPQIDSAAETPR